MNSIDQVIDEVARATAKFPTWPTDPIHAVTVVNEELGELNEALAALNIAGGRLSKSVLQAVYEPHKSGATEVRNEAVQTAAMALRFLMSLDRYEYRIGEQHKQSSEGDRFIGLRTNQLPASGMREDNLPD
jgi:hypothetical protein